MTDQSLARRDPEAIAELALIHGDLTDLTPRERAQVYLATCASVGLNPYTKPFEFLALKDDKGEQKIVLYPRVAATEQLRDIKGVSITKLESERADGLYIVRAYATDGRGRTDSAMAAVPIVKEQGEWKSTSNGKRYFEGNGRFTPLSGDALANALMRCESKAKRRVTLSLCGLGGFPQEGDFDGIPHETLNVNLADASVEEPEEPALAAWERVEADAAKLGIEHRSLPDDAPEAKVRRWTQALAEKVKTARDAQRYTEVFGSEETRTAYDLKPPRTVDVGTGETVDQEKGVGPTEQEVREEPVGSEPRRDRSEPAGDSNVARLQELLKMANRRKLHMDQQPAPGDGIEAAIAYWDARIRQHDEQAELERQRAQEGVR